MDRLPSVEQMWVMSPAQQRHSLSEKPAVTAPGDGSPAAAGSPPPIDPAAFAAGPERLAGSGPELGTLQEPGYAVTTNPLTGGRQFTVHAQEAVEAPVLTENRHDLSDDHGVFSRPLSQRLLPLQPGVEATAGHAQLLAQPEEGVTTYELIDQAKPLGGNCSLAKCAADSLKQSFSLLSSRVSFGSQLSSSRSTLVSKSWSLEPA